MTPLYISLAIVYGILAFVLIGVILVQKKNSEGLGAGMTGAGAPQTYWNKNKGRSVEGKLHFITKILGTIFILLSLVMTFISTLGY
ncbi:MAG: preprotein translocase subunit SecG [Defluviitaleaceae bacterium]|nr:preprotein translocase subunit SecG [Defluviitaleaceae bacterium]